jgi:hypothetical protein
MRTHTTLQVAKVEKAVLSTTAKARERARKKELEKKDKEGGAAAEPAAKEGPSAMDTDDKAAAAAGSGAAAKEGGGAEGAVKAEGEEGGGAGAASAPKKPDEPSSYVLTTPSRMTLQQVRFVSFAPDSRFVPVKRGAPPIGFVVLRDTRPGEPVDYAASAAVGGVVGAAGGAAGAGPAAAPVQDAEPPPPAPFGEWRRLLGAIRRAERCCRLCRVNVFVQMVLALRPLCRRSGCNAPDTNTSTCASLTHDSLPAPPQSSMAEGQRRVFHHAWRRSQCSRLLVCVPGPGVTNRRFFTVGNVHQGAVGCVYTCRQDSCKAIMNSAGCGSIMTMCVVALAPLDRSALTDHRGLT